MQIRFKKSPLVGTLQIQAGQVLDLSADCAQRFIDAGDAIAVPKAETASLRFETPPAPRFPTYRPAKKARR